MAYSSVAIIIVNWNTYDFSKSCLNQLKTLSYPNFKIFLVDNGSTDGSGQKLRIEFPEVTFHQNHTNLGFTGGNNVGIEMAKQEPYDYVLLLNNDTYFDSSFLEPLVNYLDQHQEAGAVQPLIFEKEDSSKIWHAGGVIHRFKGKVESITHAISYERAYETEWITGCSFMVRRKLIDEIGSLNATYFAYFEDVDWSLRIRENGAKLYIIPSSTLYHEVSGSTKSKKKQSEGYLSPINHYLNIRNQLLLLKSHPKQFIYVSAWLFQILKITSYLSYFLIRFRFKKLRAAFHGLCDGICHNPNSNKVPDIKAYL
ncbi:glycosyltransferase family 2 protein [Belliella kenyensis]|uniref:Glycosyltransferase family 2 protein n=1 Tax=Belliella kenyensis TaxID=1472724 RepID=A0ABV8EMN7_9BACT|nr:glycosyltransferase family 2 protein [Belliella kenyensis]MCH7401640.1 glycosyltransferase family 2 protein [Belliella kenyensis]MDN3603082.1 glycosyltransferase family 2 protein [Belliella kenyensis]